MRSFPRVYPILDSSVIPSSGRAEFLHRLGSSLADAGVRLLEYRYKERPMPRCWPMRKCCGA